MDSHNGPLLLPVHVHIAPERADRLNRWYYHHVPKLLEIPGWLWGKRYLNVKGSPKYLALYAVENMDQMDRVMASDPDLKDPRAIDERTRFDAIPGKTDVISNVYEQISGNHLLHPFLKDEHYLSVVMADCNDPAQEADWNAWYDHSHVPNLTRVPGHLSGARFRIEENPRFGSKKMGAKYLALYEWEGEHCLETLGYPDKMRPEAKAELAEWDAYGVKLADNMACNVFKPIASHWGFRW